jgi:hypothetical protein
VAEEDCGKGTSAVWLPKERAKVKPAAAYSNGARFRYGPAVNAKSSRVRQKRQQ